MNDMITSTGLNLTSVKLNTQDGLDEFKQAGKELAKMESDNRKIGQSIKWAIGDWYLALDEYLGLADQPEMLKGLPRKEATKIKKDAIQARKAACKEAGLNYVQAQEYALVADNVENPSARRTLGYDRSRSITYGIPPSKRAQFLDDAVAGNWNMSRIALEKQELTPAGKGKTEGQHLVQAFKDEQFKTAGDMLDAALDDGLSRAARARLAPRFKEIFHFLHTEALKFIKKQTKLEKARLDRELENKETQLNKEFETSMKTLRDHEMRIRELHRHVLGVDISYQDYKRIRACLHPDRAPEGREDKFRYAFTAFDTAIRERADYIYKYNRKMLKDSGWGEYKP